MMNFISQLLGLLRACEKIVGSGDEVEIAGYGELQFHPGGQGIPMRYSGHYYRPEGGGNFRKICFEGFRLDDRKDIERLENPETRKDAMRQLLKRFEAWN
ncbi:MAG: hypothetical protein ACREUD_05330 [Gammaproteobacteria bacterium]